jgi:hypothetical protein
MLVMDTSYKFTSDLNIMEGGYIWMEIKVYNQ